MSQKICFLRYLDVGSQMLVSFTVRNFRSFYETTELSMLATREQKHGERLAVVGRSRILPVAAVFGGNASGKSSLVMAVEALRTLILETRNIGDKLAFHQPNLAHAPQEATAMSVEVVLESEQGERRYLYEVEADSERILAERLTRIGARSETELLSRDGDETRLFGALAKDQRAKALAEVIDPNQTLLGVIGARRDGILKDLRDWFANQLHIIYPSSSYAALPARVSTDELFAQAMNHGLSVADTGMTSLHPRRVTGREIGLDESEKEALRRLISQEGESVVLPNAQGSPAFATLNSAGDLVFQVLEARHREGGSDFVLPLSEESDGTRRFMHLLPVLFQISQADSRATFIIDELENSLHPHLTEELISRFLGELDASSRRQLIFTTHEVSLLRAELLRRDEVWLAEKSGQATDLVSLADFADLGVRKSADVFSMYMSGRLGAVPHTSANL